MRFATCSTEAEAYLSSPGRMENAKRKLATNNFSPAAGKKLYPRRKVPRADADGKELLPGIPNHVTMENIASKLDWKTCNVLQVVSRGWHQEIHNRDVYNAKVLSKSTEAFLVVLGCETQESDRKLVLTLYSCRDHYFLRLPPIPPFLYRDYSDCICLEGRVYLWIRQWPAKQVQLYVLDLAGHKKWEERKPVNDLDQLCLHGPYNHGLGVLDGKIFTFQATTYGLFTPDDSEPLSVEERMQKLSRMKMYDPVYDTWSLVTPAPPVSAFVSNVDLEHRLASFSDWAEEKLTADPSKTFSINRRYENYFSEWKQKQSHECSTSTVDDDSGNGMAPQVYYSHLLSHSLRPPSDLKSEEVLFFRGKLIKYENYLHGFPIRAPLNILGYDAQTNIWEHWKSVSMDFQSLEDGRTLFIDKIDAFVTANNSLWAIVGVHSMNFYDKEPLISYFLLRSLELLSDDNVELLTWIDTGLQEGHGTYFEDNALKPIYL